MKILVTGHQGFIGKNMVEMLEKEHQVAGYEFNNENLPLVKGFDWVIHLGAISSTTETDVNKVIMHNYEFTKWIYNQCNAYGVNFQYASSASVYGNTENFAEDAPPQPSSPYSWSKYLFDRWIEGMRPKITVQGFRYFNVYGKYEDHKEDQASPVHKFTKQAQENKEIKIFEGSENFKRDFVCVDDVCDVHKQMLDKEDRGIWNVGTGVAVSFADVANIIAKKHNATVTEIPMPDNLKGQYQKYTCADTKKLSNIIKKEYKTVKEYVNGY